MAANRNVPLDLRLAVDCMVKLAQLKSEIAVYIFRSVGNKDIYFLAKIQCFCKLRTFPCAYTTYLIFHVDKIR